MSDTIWLETTDGGEKVGGERDNSQLLKLNEELDALASRLGAVALTSFYDNSALVEGYDEELGENAPEPEAVWFDAGVGRQSFEKILGAVRQDRAVLGKAHSGKANDLIEELEYCLGLLVDAEKRSGQFHLLVVP